MQAEGPIGRAPPPPRVPPRAGLFVSLLIVFCHVVDALDVAAVVPAVVEGIAFVVRRLVSVGRLARAHFPPPRRYTRSSMQKLAAAVAVAAVG